MTEVVIQTNMPSDCLLIATDYLLLCVEYFQQSTLGTPLFNYKKHKMYICKLL